MQALTNESTGVSTCFCFYFHPIYISFALLLDTPLLRTLDQGSHTRHSFWSREKFSIFSPGRLASKCAYSHATRFAWRSSMKRLHDAHQRGRLRPKATVTEQRSGYISRPKKGTFLPKATVTEEKGHALLHLKGFFFHPEPKPTIVCNFQTRHRRCAAACRRPISRKPTATGEFNGQITPQTLLTNVFDENRHALLPLGSPSWHQKNTHLATL